MKLFRQINRTTDRAANRREKPIANRRRVSVSNKKTANEKINRNESEKYGGSNRASWAIVKHVLSALLKFIISIALIGLIIWGGVKVHDHATTSPYFDIEFIKITGATRLNKEEILKTASLSKGDNIFSVQIDNVVKQLKEHPWILDAAAKQKLPRAIEIDIIERKPEALILFDVPYFVDDEGNVFKRWALGDLIISPIITGIPREELINDEEGIKESILDAIALARRYKATGMDVRAPLSEIHREIDGGFSFTAGVDPYYVQFGHGPYTKKLARLAKLLRRMPKDNNRPAIIYFDNSKNPDQVIVKLKKDNKEKDSSVLKSK